MRYRLSFFIILVALVVSACSGVPEKQQLPARKPERPAGNRLSVEYSARLYRWL